MPVTTTVCDDKGAERSVTVDQDEGVRPDTTMEGLAKLKPAFKKGGSTTAGETGLGEGQEGQRPCRVVSGRPEEVCEVCEVCEWGPSALP